MTPRLRISAIWLATALLAAPAFAQTPPPPTPPDHDGHQAQGQAQGQNQGHEYPSLKLSGFGDLWFATTRRPDGPHGFVEGQFVLHMASELSPRTTFFGELSFTPRTDAGTGSPAATGFNAEVERMILRFDESDRLKLSFGRYHTPINYWNTAFHHGVWLQTTISRPEMIQFGGRFLPVHFVGALVEGDVPAAGTNLHYQGGIGNGRGSVISRGGDAGDNNSFRAWLTNVFVKPDKVYGLQAGGSIYGDKITLASGREFNETIYAAHAVWQKEDPEVIAEFANVRHVDLLTNAVMWSHAYYVQAAYRLAKADRWKPYFRFEHVGVNPSDLMFQGINNLDGTTLGVRFDASGLVAVKGEFRTWTRGQDSQRNYGGFFQVCFTF